ncbi:invasion associated locus B family protein [Paradevosia shaoguanensis]|jgi:invasion protein IalB|uniref:Invasion-associated locus B family protein n=1 Tax=Paradevosia shaoguanensis TaxID=1335043 RepID=A0AA41QNG7_9HYPH|nr:invasion-associated locus B family protein [Paradevosia shaoguanensis]MBI4049101.1 invasion-associated locus B family protein [Devosia nanyangense]MCF1742576.1 invasion-associated locus B family protein [Paradevosia shaoguanensis]MCI0127059.1 invasion-associated locus B family protein [Paradevosia shaoguanensis]CDP50485.1 Invasion protein B [Devosia sp. DBB001]
MKLKNALIAGLAATALMLPSYAALAQDKPAPAAPAAEQPAAPAEGQQPAAPAANSQVNEQNQQAAADPNRAPAQNWLKVCDPIDGGKKACIMRQVVLANGQFLGSFLLRDDPGQESRLLAVAAVPLGVLLPFGLTWQIDGGKPIRVPFMLCDPQSCATQLVINEAYVNSLKKGGKLKLTAKNRQNQDLTIEINLAGFTAVYDGEAALTFDEFRKEQTGASALEQQLQDRAEQLRKELDAGQTPTQPGVSTQTNVPPVDPKPAQ